MRYGAIPIADIEDQELLDKIIGKNKKNDTDHSSRILDSSVKYPCLEYIDGDPNKCNRCDEDNDYYIWFRNYTHTLCAYARDYWYCTVPEEYYPEEYELLNTFGYYIGWYYSSNNYRVFCSDDYDSHPYYLTNEGQLVCDTYYLYSYELAISTVYYYTYMIWCMSCSVTGYTNEVALYLTQVEFFASVCTPDDEYSCSFSQYYDSTEGLCKECTSKFKNCAACNETDCILCYQRYGMNNGLFDYESGEYTDQCQYETCQEGFCFNSGSNYCQEYTIDNCLRCYDQYCIYCKPGYYVDSYGECVAYTSQTLNITYYVTSSNYYIHTNYSSFITSNDGLSPDKPLTYIYEVLYKIGKLEKSYNAMNVTILVGQGDHFFFICSGDESTMYAKDEVAGMIQQCNKYSISTVEIYMDNKNITIQALECSMASQLEYEHNAPFWSMCANISTAMPTIYVQNSYAFFNITGKMTVKNLKFSGVNALAVPTNDIYEVSKFPIKLCDVSDEPAGYDGTIELEKMTSALFNITFNCRDTLYTGSSVPKIDSATTQCSSNSYSQFSTTRTSSLSCSGYAGDTNYFTKATNGYHYYRRKTLFNLYAFSDMNTIRNSTPELIIENCQFEYFLNGYESLINIETDNFDLMSRTFYFVGYSSASRNTLHYSQGDRGAKINITDSVFKHSRFCKGMIVYRKAPFDDSTRSLLNLTHVYMKWPYKYGNDSYIYLSKSTFYNLNAFANTTALAAYGGVDSYYQYSTTTIDPINIQYFMHKGIVLNVEDFGGRIEIIDCTFKNNYHFIPAIYYGHMSTGTTFDSDNFYDGTTDEYQLAICDEQYYYDKYFFQQGIGQTDDIDEYYDAFERLSTIYISRNKNKIIIKDNTFQQNIGTFGGAISINSPNWVNGNQPYVLIFNNIFKSNMAYFSGNAIYIRLTQKSSELQYQCTGVTIKQNEFINNIGMKIHNGGAISSYCYYVESNSHQDYFSSSGYETISTSKIGITSVVDGTSFSIYSSLYNIEDNYFEANFAGMKGTTIYLRQITNLRINNCTFLGNGPVYSTQEFQYSPYVNFLSQSSITFYDSDCSDEFEYLSSCNNDANQMIIWPRVQGAIHVIYCQTQSCINPNYTQSLEISDSYFVKNQAGPIFDSEYTSTYATASQIHIVGGFNNLIQNNQFLDNYGDFTAFPNAKNYKLYNYFPSSYFKHSMSSLINIYISPGSSENFMNFNTTFNSNKFYRNKNIQVLGFQSQQQYYGSIIKAVNYAYNAQNYLPVVNINECDFKDNYFQGELGSLIYVSNMLLISKYSTYINNGYLFSSVTTKDVETDMNIDSTYNNFESYTFSSIQQYGIFYVDGDISFPFESYHYFLQNTFSYIFSEYGGAYSFFINNQYAYLYGNTYKYIFSNSYGPLLYGEGSSSRSTIALELETGSYLYGGTGGAITISPIKQDLMNLYVNNSYFINIQSYYGSGLYLDNAAKVTLRNVTFTRDNYIYDMAAYIKAKFKLYSMSFNSFIEQSVAQKLSNNVTQFTGYIEIQNVLNSQIVKFANKTLHAAGYKYIGYVEVLDCDFLNQISEYSPVADVSASKLRVANTFGGKRRYIKNNTATKVGPFGIQFVSTFIGENLYITNNTSKAKASALYLSQSSASIINTTFIYNNASSLGTVVVETNSDFTCYNCSFISNYAYDSSGIFTYNNLKQFLMINNSQFLNNTSVSNLMNLLYSKTLITNTTFLNNIAQKVNNGISMINSNVSLVNSTINFTNTDYIYKNDFSVDTGFISLNYQSYMVISNSVIQYCRGSISAFIYITGSSQVYILDSTIKNIASVTGSVVYGSMAKGVYITRVNFISNSQIDIHLENTVGYIYNNYFFEGSQQFISVKSGSIDLQNNQFKNGHNQNIYGKALFCYCIELNATGNTFSNLSATQGGAIYLQSYTYSKFSIQKNQFRGNSAQMGGAIYILNAARLDILSNLFVANTAQVISPQTIESSKITQKGLGGAIYYGCTNDDIRDQGGCVVNIKQGNLFENNYAQDEGGAIQRVSYAYNDDGTNVFVNNSAYYGNDSASYPKSISIKILSNGDYVNNFTGQSETTGRRLSDISYVPTFVSGTPFSFNVFILDQYGSVYVADSSSKCAFKYAGTSTTSSVVVTNNEVIAQRGVYYFANVTVSAQPGTQMAFKLEITGLETHDNSIEFIDSPFQFNVTVRDCVMGEELTSDSKCRACQPGTYLYDPPSVETACKICPANAECYGKYHVAPNPGYWRSTNISENFILCENVDACLGGNITNPIGICAAGYSDILCGNCNDNYYKKKEFECSKCPERIRNIIQISFILAFACAYVLFLVRSTLNSADKEKPLYSVYMKVMTNHIQVLSAISNIKYNWPQQITTFQDNQNEVSSISDSVFSFDCFFMNNGKDNGPMPVYYQKLVLYGFLPIILAICDYLVWLLICFIKGRDFSQLRSKTTSTLVVLLFLVHPNIVKAIFLSFNCIDIDGIQRLKENISSICYKNEHLTYLLLISAPSVIAWCLGIPFFALILLYANRKTLVLLDETMITETEHKKIIETKLKYGFIFAGYRGETYYWEVILLYRKIGIIMSTVYLSTLSNEAQVLAVMMIIVMALLLQISYKPYYTDVLNKMEIYSLQVSAFTLYAGMYYVTGSHYQYMDNDGLAWFFLTFIVTPNAIFFLFWSYHMRLEILKEIYNRKHQIKLLAKVFKIIACQTIDEFEKGYILPMREKQVKISIVKDGTLERDKKIQDEIPVHEFEEEPNSTMKVYEDTESQYELSDIQLEVGNQTVDSGTLSTKKANKQAKKKNKMSKEMKVHPSEKIVDGVVCERSSPNRFNEQSFDQRNLTSHYKEMESVDYLLDFNMASEREQTYKGSVPQRSEGGFNNTLGKMKKQSTRVKLYLQDDDLDQDAIQLDDASNNNTNIQIQNKDQRSNDNSNKGNKITEQDNTQQLFASPRRKDKKKFYNF